MPLAADPTEFRAVRHARSHSRGVPLPVEGAAARAARSVSQAQLQIQAQDEEFSNRLKLLFYFQRVGLQPEPEHAEGAAEEHAGESGKHHLAVGAAADDGGHNAFDNGVRGGADHDGGDGDP